MSQCGGPAEQVVGGNAVPSLVISIVIGRVPPLGRSDQYPSVQASEATERTGEESRWWRVAVPRGRGDLPPASSLSAERPGQPVRNEAARLNPMKDTIETSDTADQARRTWLHRFVRLLRCWYDGHETPPDYYGDNTCLHCGKWVPAGETMGARNRWRHWWNYQRPEWLRTRFYRKCRDCGKRFNNHTSECPPF